MPRVLCSFLTFAILLLRIGPAAAEVPLRSAEQLREGATHIVVGELRTVYRSVKRGAGHEDTSGLAEIVVEKVEQGSGIEPGQALFVRFWTRRWIGTGSPPPGSNGHHLQREGAVVRAYVERAKDGSFEVLLPNGLTLKSNSADNP